MCVPSIKHIIASEALSVSIWERSVGKWGMIGEWLFAVSHSCDMKIHREEELLLAAWQELTTNRWRWKLVGGAERGGLRTV